MINVIAPRRSLKLTIPSPSRSKLLNTICAYLAGSPSGNSLAYAGFKSPDVAHPLGHSCLKARYNLRISFLENPVRQVKVDSCSGKTYNECLSSSWILSTKTSSYIVNLSKHSDFVFTRNILKNFKLLILELGIHNYMPSKIKAIIVTKIKLMVYFSGFFLFLLIDTKRVLSALES